MRLRSRLLPLALTAFAAFAAFAASPAAAQPPAGGGGPQLFVVHTETPVPSRLADYEKSCRDFKALVEANRELMPGFGFTAFQGEDLSYAFISPIRSFADIDAVYGGFEALGKAAGSRWADLMRLSSQVMSSADDRVFAMVPEASYWPANAHVSMTEAAYYELDFYRVIPGMEQEAIKVAMDWKALYESHQVPYGYTVYRLALGENAPLFLVTIPAKSEADLAMVKEKSRQMIGGAFGSQMAKTMAVSRGFEVRRYQVRPDLSLMAPPRAERPQVPLPLEGQGAPSPSPTRATRRTAESGRDAGRDFA
jgi:hypothetical protein